LLKKINIVAIHSESTFYDAYNDKEGKEQILLSEKKKRSEMNVKGSVI
jgi:hypothetical protein